MAVSTSTRLIHDDGPDWNLEQINYPIAALGPGTTAIKFEVTGGLTLQTIALVPDKVLASEYVVGIQYGPEPYTPLPVNLDATIDGGRWVFAQTVPSFANSAAWSNEADTGGFIQQVNLNYLRYAQVVVPDGPNYDFLLSVGPNIDISLLLGFRAFLTVRMWAE